VAANPVAAPAQCHAVIRAGDTLYVEAVFTDDAGAAVDKSGSSWLAKVKKARHLSAADATFTVDASFAVSGVVTFSLPAATTATLSGRRYTFDVQETTAAGEVVTVIEGTLTDLEDTSR
jgi:hypothetical protein